MPKSYYDKIYLATIQQLTGKNRFVLSLFATCTRYFKYKEYECTMDQELYRIQRASDVTRARRASGHPRTLLRMQQRAAGGHHGCHLESVSDIVSEIQF